MKMIKKVLAVICICLLVSICTVYLGGTSGLLTNMIQTDVSAAVNDSTSVSDWVILYSGVTATTLCYPDITVKHTGNASLKMVNTSGHFANVFQAVYPKINIATTKDNWYRFTFWYKANNVVSRFRWYPDLGTTASLQTCIGAPTAPVTCDWTLVTYDWQATTNSPVFRLQLEDFGVVWVDDVSVVPISGKDGDVTGENLIKYNSNFETVETTPPANPSAVSVVTGFDTANLNWTNAADNDYDRANVYKVNTDNSLTLVGSVNKPQSGSTSSIQITDLSGGQNYMFRIKSVDRVGNESSGTDISVSTPITQINNPVFQKQGVGAITSLQDGIITTSVDVYTVQDAVQVALIVALYDGDKMIDFSLVKKSISKTLQGQADRLQVALPVPDLTQGDYRLQTFVCDDLYAMKQLIGKTSFDKQGITYQ